MIEKDLLAGHLKKIKDVTYFEEYLAKIIADEGISIRQAIGEDYDLAENPRFIIVTEAAIPDKLISKIRQVEGIKGITIY